MRVDHTLSEKDSLFGRYTVDTGAIDNNATFPNFRQTLPGVNQFLTLGETHVFSAALLNSLRLSGSRTTQNVNNVFVKSAYNDAQHSFVVGMPMGSWGALGGITGFGAQNTKPSLDNLTLYNLTDDVSFTNGRHSLRFGTLLNLYLQAAGTNGGASGSLSFSSFANFMMGNISGGQVLSLPPGVAPNPTAPNVNRYFGYSTYGFYPTG